MSPPRIPPLVRLTLVMSALFVAMMVGLIVDVTWNDRDAEEPETAATVGVSAPVEEFLAFVEGTPGRDVPPVGLEHEYTAEGIIKLAAALEALGGSRPDQLVDFRHQADALRRDPTSLKHADVVRDVCMTAARILRELTGNDVGDVRDAAEAIDPDRALLQQSDAVRGFFRSAADVIRDQLREHDRDSEK